MLQPKPMRAPHPINNPPNRRGQQRFRRRPGGARERFGGSGCRHRAEDHAEVGEARRIGEDRFSERALRAGPLPEFGVREIKAGERRELCAPYREAEGDAPGMMAGKEHADREKADDDAADEDRAPRPVIRAARAGDGGDHQRGGRDAGERDGEPAPRAEVSRCKDRVDAAERQKRRQMQAADDAAHDEQRERDQHPAGAAARGVKRAGAAAVRELHADAEHEGADDERRSDRRNGSAEAGHERSDRHDHDRRNGDQQQRANEATRLPAHQKAPPRRRERELGFQKRHAERKAAEDQCRGRKLPVEAHQRDQHSGAEQRRDEEGPVESRQCCGGRFNSRRGHIVLCHPGRVQREPGSITTACIVAHRGYGSRVHRLRRPG